MGVAVTGKFPAQAFQFSDNGFDGGDFLCQGAAALIIRRYPVTQQAFVAGDGDEVPGAPEGKIRMGGDEVF